MANFYIINIGPAPTVPITLVLSDFEKEDSEYCGEAVEVNERNIGVQKR